MAPYHILQEWVWMDKMHQILPHRLISGFEIWTGRQDLLISDPPAIFMGLSEVSRIQDVVRHFGWAEGQRVMACHNAWWLTSLSACKRAALQKEVGVTAFYFQKVNSICIILNFQYFYYMLIRQLILFTRWNKIYSQMKSLLCRTMYYLYDQV
jgi:hypothetical protein